LDDVIPAKNVDRYNASVDALQIARIELANAEENLADYDTILADLKTILDDAQDLFENAEALVDAQTAVVEAALEAEMAATLAVAAAGDASAAAVVANAAAVVVAGEFPSEQSLIDLSAQLAVDNQQIAIDVAELAIDVADIEVEIARILAQIEIGKTPEAIAAEEVLATVTAEANALDNEAAILNFNIDALMNVMDAIVFVLFEINDLDFITEAIDILNDEIVGAKIDLALTETTIANLDTESDFNAALGVLELAGIDSDIAALQSRGEFYTALVAKYKALVDSLL